MYDNSGRLRVYSEHKVGSPANDDWDSMLKAWQSRFNLDASKFSFIYECNDFCKCSSRCQNRVSQTRLGKVKSVLRRVDPLTLAWMGKADDRIQYRDPVRYLYVVGDEPTNSTTPNSIRLRTDMEFIAFPARLVEAGELVCLYVGKIRAKADIKSDLPSVSSQRLISIDDNADFVIDPSQYGNISRFFLVVEQIESANVEMIPIISAVDEYPKIGVFAKRRIYPTEPYIFCHKSAQKRCGRNWKEEYAEVLTRLNECRGRDAKYCSIFPKKRVWGK